MQSISTRLGEYLIGSDGAPAGYAVAVNDRDLESALSVLRGCVGDAFAMRSLRAVIDEHDVGHASRRLSDVDVVERVATLVSRGWVQLATPVLPPLIKVGGKDKAAAAQRVVGAPAPARQAAVASDEPSFIPNVDQAALAATLAAASESGVPFCEECARARAAA